LAAVSVERTGTPLGEDVPGDEAAGSRGIPFRQQDVEDAEFEFGFQGPAAPLCPGLPDLRIGPGEETCFEPQNGQHLAEWSTIGAPVPLFFTPGACTGQSGSPQTYGKENPAIPWDGDNDEILTYQNCSTGDEEINFGTLRGTCPGAAPYGLLIAFYQLPDGAENPFNPAAVCTNNVFPANPNVIGFCEDGPCLYTVGPGEYQVLIQTNLIGGSCTGTGVDYTIDVN
jgi:hypothetical protein